MSAINQNDPRVKRTRQLLLNAFHELAAEKDLREISVQEIAERATLNRATFYAHFRDKDALMDTAFRGRFHSMLIAKIPPSSPVSRENLRLLFHLVCDFLNTTVRRCPKSIGERHPLMKAAVQEELYAFILNWLRECAPQSAGKRVPLEWLASLLSWSLFGTTLEWVERPLQRSQEQVAAELVDLMIEGAGSVLCI